jgi:hypothetical protein
MRNTMEKFISGVAKSTLVLGLAAQLTACREGFDNRLQEAMEVCVKASNGTDTYPIIDRWVELPEENRGSSVIAINHNLISDEEFFLSVGGASADSTAGVFVDVLMTTDPRVVLDTLDLPYRAETDAVQIMRYVKSGFEDEPEVVKRDEQLTVNLNLSRTFNADDYETLLPGSEGEYLSVWKPDPQYLNMDSDFTFQTAVVTGFSEENPANCELISPVISYKVFNEGRDVEVSKEFGDWSMPKNNIILE